MLRHARRVLAAAVVGLGVAVACSSSSTEPSVLNLRAGVPSNWVLVGQISATYSVGTDDKTVHGGDFSLGIVGIDTSRLRFSGVGQFIKADSYRGKRVRLSAWIRQSNLVGTSAGLWMRIDGPGATLGFDNFSSRPQLGTSDWHQVEVILDVPPSAIGIAFGALMSARGELFVDDMSFEVVPATGPTTNQLVDPTPGADSATTVANYARAATTPANLGFER